MSSPGLLLVAVVALAGCSTSTGPSDTPVALDEDLDRAITLDGQRRISNFQLPASDDFDQLPQDPRNPLTADKVALGKWLFHEPGLSATGTVSCATCHHAGAGFQAGAARSIGSGGVGWGRNGEGRTAGPGADVPRIRAPSALHAAFQRVQHWSGQFGADGPNDRLPVETDPDKPGWANTLGYRGAESQAIGAMMNHGLRGNEQAVMDAHPAYSEAWERAWPGQAPTMERVGLTIAAYERTLTATEAPFQRWLQGDVTAMDDAQKRGALLFFGKALCADCHTGPALNSMAFYSLGMRDQPGLAPSDPLAAGRFAASGDAADRAAFKVPQLYNLADSPFLGHGGTFRSVEEVITYYNDGIPDVQTGNVTPRFAPLNLTIAEVDDLIAFVRDALRDPNLDRYSPSSLPSGNCFPANDAAARRDLGC